MARIHDDSDDELPPLQTIINRPNVPAGPATARSDGVLNAKSLVSPVKKRQSPTKKATTSGKSLEASARLHLKAGSADAGDEGKTERRLQRPLRVAHVNSLLLPVIPARSEQRGSPRKSGEEGGTGGFGQLRIGRVRDTPRRAVKREVKYDLTAVTEQDDILEEVERIRATEEESSWCGDEDDKEGESDTKRDGIETITLDFSKMGLLQRPKLGRNTSSRSSTASLEPEGLIDLTSPVRHPQKPKSNLPSLQYVPKSLFPQSKYKLSSSSENEENDQAVLRLYVPCPTPHHPSPPPSGLPSPTDLYSSPPHSPFRRKFPSADSLRPVTPPPEAPPSPSKSRLASPSKQRLHIPPTPHRPSIDAFWSQDVVNDWNDQYSPKKLLRSPKKLHFLLDETASDDDAELSPSENRNHSASPRKLGRVRSPAKKDHAAVQAKKDFEASKRTTAEDLLKEIDRVVTGGIIGEMCAETGGVKIVWSKKLNSTAGRANWKREGVRIKSNPSNDEAIEGKSEEDAKQRGSEVKWRHIASIELAEKVIDDEDRLRNVLAHEYCHLANFMISGVKNNPHGKEFKEWAAKVTQAFRAQNITVTTKHTYTITYKYIWQCASPLCGLEYKRHSKSIDTAKHTCGSCKGKLVQVKPVPRRGVGGGKEKGEGGDRSEYQVFVKERFGRVRDANPEWGLGRVMEELGREYRGLKGVGRKGEVVETEVGGEGSEQMRKGRERKTEDEGLDGVVDLLAMMST